MRSAATVLTLLAVLSVAGCIDDTDPAQGLPANDPCAATRDQPPPDSGEQRKQADLDGDGSIDEVVSWVRDGQRVAQAWLATGRNAVPEPLFSGSLLAAPDIDRDGRAEVLAATGPTTGAAFVLDGCRLVPVRVVNREQAWEYAIGPGALLLCRPRGLVEEAVNKGAETARRAWTLSEGEVTAANPVGSGPVTAGGIRCS